MRVGTARGKGVLPPTRHLETYLVIITQREGVLSGELPFSLISRTKLRSTVWGGEGLGGGLKGSANNTETVGNWELVETPNFP